MAEVLLDSRDLPPGGATIITGAAEVTQNITEAIATPYGSLPWDRKAGSHLFFMLNDLVDRSATIAELRRVALSFADLVKSSVAVRWNPQTQRYEVKFIATEMNRVVVIPVTLP